MRLYEVFRCRHLHDIIHELTTGEDHLTEINMNPRNMQNIKLLDYTGFARTNSSFVYMEYYLWCNSDLRYKLENAFGTFTRSDTCLSSCQPAASYLHRIIRSISLYVFWRAMRDQTILHPIRYEDPH